MTKKTSPAPNAPTKKAQPTPAKAKPAPAAKAATPAKAKVAAAKTKPTPDSPELLAFATPDLADSGQGRVVVACPASKSAANVDVAIFDVDTQCLGIREIKIATLPLTAFAGRFLSALGVTAIPAPTALAIVVGAAAYAKKLGFTAPVSFPSALTLFGAEKPGKLDFSFGKNGKPFYTQSLEDDDEFVERVLTQLEKVCGKNGFGYLLVEDNEELLDAADSEGSEDDDLDPDYDGFFGNPDDAESDVDLDESDFNGEE